MHRFRAQLHLKGASITGVHGRVDGLVAIWFWKSDIVFYLSWHRAPMGVDDTERRVAVGDAGKNNAEGTHVINFGDIPPLPFQFPVQTIHALDACFRTKIAQFRLGKFAFEIVLDLPEAPLILTLLFLKELPRLLVFFGIRERECSVLKF